VTYNSWDGWPTTTWALPPSQTWYGGSFVCQNKCRGYPMFISHHHHHTSPPSDHCTQTQDGGSFICQDEIILWGEYMVTWPLPTVKQQGWSLLWTVPHTNTTSQTHTTHQLMCALHSWGCMWPGRTCLTTKPVGTHLQVQVRVTPGSTNVDPCENLYPLSGYGSRYVQKYAGVAHAFHHVYIDLHFAYLTINHPSVLMPLTEANQQSITPSWLPSLYLRTQVGSCSQFQICPYTSLPARLLAPRAKCLLITVPYGEFQLKKCDSQLLSYPIISYSLASAFQSWVMIDQGKHISRNSAALSSTSALLQLTIINPEGCVWTAVASGSAFVIYSNTIAIHNLNFVDELANYQKYSGAPNKGQTFKYTKNNQYVSPSLYCY